MFTLGGFESYVPIFAWLEKQLLDVVESIAPRVDSERFLHLLGPFRESKATTGPYR